MINLKKITESNFIDAFQLNLREGQEKYVSNPIRSLAQAYVYREQCSPLEYMMKMKLSFLRCYSKNLE